MNNKQIELLNNEDGYLSQEDIILSNQMYELLANKRVVATRIKTKDRCELCIKLEGGTTLFVDNFKDSHDISIT